MANEYVLGSRDTLSDQKVSLLSSELVRGDEEEGSVLLLYSYYFNQSGNVSVYPLILYVCFKAFYVAPSGLSLTSLTYFPVGLFDFRFRPIVSKQSKHLT